MIQGFLGSGFWVSEVDGFGVWFLSLSLLRPSSGCFPSGGPALVTSQESGIRPTRICRHHDLHSHHHNHSRR